MMCRSSVLLAIFVAMRRHIYYGKSLGYIMCLSLICTCTSTQLQQSTVRLARVANDELYLRDIQDDYSYNHLKGVDSTIYLRKYVKNWVKQTLLYHHATQKLARTLDFTTIEKKTRAYKKTLTLHALQAHYLEKESPHTISEEEIRSYYQHNMSNFSLEHTLVQAIWAKIPLTHPKKRILKKTLQAYTPKDSTTIAAYCASNPLFCHLQDTLWKALPHSLKAWPQHLVDKVEQKLSNQSFFTLQDHQYHYFLRITDYRSAQNFAPLAYVRDRIMHILQSQKRAQLLQSLEDKIWEEAQANHHFEIYF